MAERSTSEQDLSREPPIEVANEFALVRVCKVHTKHGERLEISSPKRGRLIRLDPLELEWLACMDDESFLGGNAINLNRDDNGQTEGRP